MITGVGIDIVEIARIGRLVDTYGDQFLNKVFTESEIAWCKKKARPEVHLAGRWAAKEAFYKALPKDCQPHSTWKSIQILPDKSGKKPCVEICDAQLKLMLEKHDIGAVHISISHEQSMCTSVIVVEQI